jgi:hypothetical protein
MGSRLKAQPGANIKVLIAFRPYLVYNNNTGNNLLSENCQPAAAARLSATAVFPTDPVDAEDAVFLGPRRRAGTNSGFFGHLPPRPPVERGARKDDI